MIVNGHNGIPSVYKTEKAKMKLLEKIKIYKTAKNAKLFRYYYATHYRELAILFGKEGNVKKMNYYMRKSLQSHLLSPKKYVRFITILLQKHLHVGVKK